MNISGIDSTYRLNCATRFPPPSSIQVEKLERRLRISFPVDFKNYLLLFNGGIFDEPDIRDPIGNGSLDRLTFMNGIGATEPIAELAQPSDLSLFDDNFPPRLLPIGYTLMGSLILLVTDSDGYGHVLLKPCSTEDAIELAESISGFFDLLCSRLETE